jgi:hypothetical protein
MFFDISFFNFLRKKLNKKTILELNKYLRIYLKDTFGISDYEKVEYV